MTLPLLCCGPSPALQRALVFPAWEQSGDVVRATDVAWTVGGKATNAARAIVRAGGQATLLGFAGGDNGRRMAALLRAEGLEGLWVECESETRICQTLLDGGHRRIRELVEEAGPVSLGEWGELFAETERALLGHAALLLCGSLPRGTPSEAYATLAEIAVQHRRPWIIDAQGPALRAALPHRPWLVKINRAELAQTTGETEIPAGMAALRDAGAKLVLITDGPETAWLLDGKKTRRFLLPSIEAVNPIGGGDTVCGVAALALAEGKDPVEAARAGLAAALAQTLTPRPAEFDPAVAADFARRIRVE